MNCHHGLFRSQGIHSCQHPKEWSFACMTIFHPTPWAAVLRFGGVPLHGISCTPTQTPHKHATHAHTLAKQSHTHTRTTYTCLQHTHTHALSLSQLVFPKMRTESFVLVRLLPPVGCRGFCYFYHSLTLPFCLFSTILLPSKPILLPFFVKIFCYFLIPLFCDSCTVL